MGNIAAFTEGFMVSLGLIVAVGPQNAYLLRQGLRHRHVGAVSTVCFLSDIILIILGVMGVGRLIASHTGLSVWLGWGGVLFLLWFALKNVRSALHPDVMTDARMRDAAGDAAGQGVRTAVLHTLAFTWLNPWVYVDTMVLIGGVSTKYAGDMARISFCVGAILASGVWFYGLGFGAKKAAPLFRKPMTWRILDSVIALIMLGVATLLIKHQLQL
ncbi:LysE/ArgO family amino acid transporter [Kordiimonas marina]|uniref:LysE/ArgO family amino acid transporter n=1 Tax=Kordiimonas marina TaxID=2872312 RepID=UPI001FF1265B|nr:LysE/ArgO family amino acid transporter [Kordiimonas marina]MCJ9429387.1 LysE/ArgO family amino acid transporter [Kordiimonas marina]